MLFFIFLIACLQTLLLLQMSHANTHLPNSEIPNPLHVVLSAYDEDLGGVTPIFMNNNFSYTLYRRSDKDSEPMKQKIEFENVGRESYVYLKHIIEHYHHLAERIVFTQAHTLCVEKYAEDLINLNKGVLKLSPENDGFAFLMYTACQIGSSGYVGNGSAQIFYDIQVPVGFNGPTMKFSDIYKNLLKVDPVPENPRFIPTGCFVVTREAIHRQPREYYIKLIRTLNYENNPKIGFLFERAWPSVFHSSCTSGKKFQCVLANSNAAKDDLPHKADDVKC